MRSSTYSYKKLFRSTALAALGLGILPAYAQVETHPYSLGVSAKRTSVPVDPASVKTPPDLLTPHHRSKQDLLKQAQQRGHRRAGPDGKVDWSAYQRAIRQRARYSRASRASQPLFPAANDGDSLMARLMGITPIGGGGNITTGPVSTWTSLGPYNMATPYGQPLVFTGPGANTGRINAIARDPKNVGVIYIAAPTGGIWKTTDGGSNWTPMTDSQFAGGIPVGLSFSSIVVDPNDSQTLYAGSGDYDQTYFPGIGTAGSGVFKSKNGGATWQRLNGLNTGINSLRAIAVDPKNSLHVTVGLGRALDAGALDGAVYSSMDGGTTWTSVPELGGSASPLNGFVNKLVYNSDGSALYAAVDGDGVYIKDTHANNTWQKIYALDHADPNTDPIFSRLDVAASPTDPNKVYVLSAQETSISKSINRGASFSDITNGFPNDYTLGDGGVWGQALYDFNLAVGSQTTAGGPSGGGGGVGVLAATPPGTTTSDVIYVSLFSVIAGDENGIIWNDISFSYTYNAKMHTDQHAFCVDPTAPNTFFAGSDGGISKGVYNPDTKSAQFTNLNATLCITQFYDIVSHPTDPGILLGGTQDNAQPYVTGDFKHWATLTGGDGAFAAIDPNYPATQYCSYVYGITYQNGDDGWSNLINGGPRQPYYQIPMPTVYLAFTPPMVMDWVDTEFVYGAEQQFFIYDHGPIVDKIKPGKWAKGAKILATDAGNANHFKYDYATALDSARTIGDTGEEIVYAGTSLGTVWYSGDQGGSATEAWYQGGNNPQWVPDVQVTAVKPDPLNPKRLFMGIGGSGLNKPHLYRCDNITKTHPVWIPIDGGTGSATGLPDIPVTAFELLPQDDAMVMYAGTEIGLYSSTNGGATWTPVDISPSDVMPNTEISQIVFNASTGNLDVSTYGRGIWRKTVGNDTPFQMQLGLTRSRGSKTKLTAKVDFFHVNVAVDDYPNDPRAAVITNNLPGGPVTDYFHYFSAPTETRKVTLSASGYLTTNISSKGVYDVYVTVPGYLRKRIPVVQTTRGLLLSTALIPGDVNGDNIIDGNDVAAVARAIGMHTNGPLDVDGDGIVTGRDLAIVIANANQFGD